VSEQADSGAGHWPRHLRPGALRWARASSHYDDTVAFYRDLVGLPVIDEFSGSFGEDGTIFGLPGFRTHLEIVRASGAVGAAGELDQIVLYFASAAAVTAATSRLLSGGLPPDPAPHPYWAAHGAVTFLDPDGRGVVFAPWVYGHDPVPGGSEGGQASRPATPLQIDLYDGDRAAVRPLFELAEDSAVQLDGYLHEGIVLVARRAGHLVGHLQLVASDTAGEAEVKNMGVVPEYRGSGVGRALVDAAVERCRVDGSTRIVVATGAADVGNLRFYQRCGFRLTSVEPDAFTPETGYPEPIMIDGVLLRDRVWLARDV